MRRVDERSYGLAALMRPSRYREVCNTGTPRASGTYTEFQSSSFPEGGCNGLGLSSQSVGCSIA